MTTLVPNVFFPTTEVDLVIQERIFTITKLFYLGIDVIIYFNIAVVIIVTSNLTQVLFF